MATYKVLSTKKLVPSLVQKAGQAGIDLVEKEFISVHPILTEQKRKEVLSWLLIRQACVVFTSAQAVEAVRKHLEGSPPPVPEWSVFCMCGKTREAVDMYLPKSKVTATAEKAAELASEIIKSKVQQVVFFCGNKRRDELPGLLQQQGISVQEVIVYETREVPTAVTNDMDGILFFSPSAVHSFFSVNQLSGQTVCFAIGPTTADALAAVTKNKIIVSASPSQEVLINRVQSYFHHINAVE